MLSAEEKNALDVAYIAGLFDGEGTVYINKNANSYTVFASVAMTEPEAPEKCKAVFGGKIYIKKQRDNRYKKVTHWLLSGVAAVSFLKAIQPYSITKAGSIRIVLEFYEHYWLPGRNKPSIRRMELGDKYRHLLSLHQHRSARIIWLASQVDWYPTAK